MEVKTFFAQKLTGDVIANPQVYLYLPDTPTLATGLKDVAGNPLSNPFIGNIFGHVVLQAPNGQYDLRIVGEGRDFKVRVHFLDVNDVINDTSSILQGYVTSAEQIYANTEQQRLLAQEAAQQALQPVSTSSIAEHVDVDFPSAPVNGQALVYNGSVNRWQNAVIDSSRIKAWVNFNATGAIAIRAGFNVTSITDNGTGDYTINFASPMSDINYAVFVTITGAVVSGVAHVVPYIGAPGSNDLSGYVSTSAVRISTYVTTNSAQRADPVVVNVQVVR